MNKIIVIGGGASGLVAAINAKNDNNEVIILEKNSVCGKKILVTGAGKCNYFNEDLSTDEETKETWKAAKFITSFAEGNIEIEKKELSNRKKKQLNKILKMFKKKGIKI